MISSLTASPAWAALQKHSAGMRTEDFADLVARDPGRGNRMTLSYEGLTLHYGLNKVVDETLKLLLDLAQQQKVFEWRDRLFAGEKINTTENRAVLHPLLRQEIGTPVKKGLEENAARVEATFQRIKQFVEDVRHGHRRGVTGHPLRHIVNIGIGGSDLGPRMLYRALAAIATGPKVHFVANADAYELHNLLQQLDPAETLFVVVSKTFTTEETLLNAQISRHWLEERLGKNAVASHVVAVSSNSDEVRKFGVSEDSFFPMWDWVGGRFSLWSAVGISLALGLGMRAYRDLLRGASSMDQHFQEAPLAENLPVLLALLGVWNRNFMGAEGLAILPYSERLRDLPRYLQQLDMESNGKHVTREGHKVDYETAPLIFGECGTVGQHSFHQWLHQGTDIVAHDFIAVLEDDLGQPASHEALLSNLAAQAVALAYGKKKSEKPEEVYEGERPSNVLTLKFLDPYTLGLLLALYEHKVFIQGVLWNINSFDQPGVELGKKMAKSLKLKTVEKTEEGQFLQNFWKNIKGPSKQ